jgi:hypothetical protein
MNWKLVHEDVTLEESKVLSRSTVYLCDNDTTMLLAGISEPEEHILGAKKVLVDSANLLKRLAREMESKADKLK